MDIDLLKKIENLADEIDKIPSNYMYVEITPNLVEDVLFLHETNQLPDGMHVIKFLKKGTDK